MELDLGSMTPAPGTKCVSMLDLMELDLRHDVSPARSASSARSMLDLTELDLDPRHGRAAVPRPGVSVPYLMELDLDTLCTQRTSSSTLGLHARSHGA